jgi:hypothetical protein
MLPLIRCLALAVALGSTACGSEYDLMIVQAQVPDARDTACNVLGTSSTDRLGEGVLDLATDRDRPYLLFLLLANGPGDPAGQGGAAAQGVQVESSHVRLSEPPGARVSWPESCANEFDYPTATASIAPGSTAVVKTEAMRPCHARVLREHFLAGSIGFDASIAARVVLTATVHMRGRYAGAPVHSGDFRFPIRVCLGCLQTGYGEPELASFSYPARPPCGELAGNPHRGNPCNPGQDDLVLCCAPDASAPEHVQCPGIPAGTATATATGTTP